MTTTMTVGYGDILPTTLPSKIISLFYFPIGITLVVMLVSLIRATALTSVNERFVRGLQAARRRRKEVLMKRQVEAGAAVRQGEMATGEQGDMPNDELDADGWQATEDHESYEKMLKAAAYRHNHAYTSEILLSSVAFIISWGVGAIVFKELEDWPFFTAFYFMFISYTAIGFGDYTPTTPGARAFYVAWGVVGMVILTVLISLIAEAWSTRYSNMLRKLVIRRHRTLQMDVEKAGDRDPNAAPPHISTVPSQQSRIFNDALAPANRVPLDIVREDLDILEQDVTDHASPVRLEMDFKRLLDDCEECLLALLNDDHDTIRKNLSKVLYERDRISDPETEKTLLKQEKDDIVKLMLLKHIHNEIVDIKRNVTLRKES
ncbi:hypothetical protein BS47DRAFT_654445 [Hydnum rufescens UP504]|uniref:Potassium channel domain-containing protein n=1 Tax=Hydnum rufescens UP504 TaxID=1448309 RepID=A0A9P6B412_9AGAM|nr:hypothetical protein BS47DRAFT_654445 [Hydnum rufescens UP504]